MDPNTIQQQIIAKSQALGQRVASAPVAPDTANDPELGALRGQHADKIKQLFAHDTQVAQVNFQPKEAPGPHAEGYTAPESRILDPLIGQRASSAQTQATAGELGDIMTRISGRRAMLDDAYNKALTLHEKNIRAQESEISMLDKIFQNQMQLKQFEAAQEKEKKSGASDKDLQTYLDTIMGLKGRREAASVPAEDSGYLHEPTKAKSIEEIKKVQRTLPKSSQISYTKNPDGSYTYLIEGAPTKKEAMQKKPKGSELRYEGNKYTVTKPGQKFITEEESSDSIYDDLLNAFSANSAKDRTAATDMTESVAGKDSLLGKQKVKTELAEDIVTAMGSGKQSKDQFRRIAIAAYRDSLSPEEIAVLIDSIW